MKSLKTEWETIGRRDERMGIGFIRKRFRSMARKPVVKTNTYLKYGFVLMEREYYCCPKCGDVLNAGPNYQPKYCDQCGKRVDFTGIQWKEEKELERLDEKIMIGPGDGNE